MWKQELARRLRVLCQEAVKKQGTGARRKHLRRKRETQKLSRRYLNYRCEQKADGTEGARARNPGLYLEMGSCVGTGGYRLASSKGAGGIP